MRHKWEGGFLSKVRDGGIAYCRRCGCIKQYVKGFPTYFIDGNVYDKLAPDCKSEAVIVKVKSKSICQR